MSDYDDQVAAARAAATKPTRRTRAVTVAGAVEQAYRTSDSPPPAEVLRFVLAAKGVKAPGLDALSDEELMTITKIGRTVDIAVRKRRGR